MSFIRLIPNSVDSSSFELGGSAEADGPYADVVAPGEPPTAAADPPPSWPRRANVVVGKVVTATCGLAELGEALLSRG